MNALDRRSARLAWALLASLLLHIAIVGDIGNLHWWQPVSEPSMPPALDVDILPVEDSGKQPTHNERKPTITETPSQPPSQQIPQADPLASPPTVEAVITEEPPAVDADQNSTADLRSGAPQLAVQQDANRSDRRLPPNGKLIYRFYWGKSRWLAGQAIHQWLIQDGYYTLSSTISTTGLFQLFHPLKLVETSKGKINGDTLRPLQFSTQLNDYPLAVAIFDWDAGNFRWFRGKTSFTQPLPANSYDKISYLYQLYLSPEREKYYSSEITTGRRLEHYDILNLGTEEVEVDGRIYQALHLSRATSSAEMEQIDIWLSTAMNKLPLKMTYENQAGDHFEQLISADSLPAP